MEPIKIFLSSSTDGLELERNFFSAFVLSDISVKYGLKIKTLLWEEERGRYTDPNKTIQEGITPLLEDSTLVIFIFYDRIGPGVRQEFNEACRLGKKMLIYKKNYQYDRSKVAPEKRKEWRELEDFYDELDLNKNKDFTIDYNNIQDLRESLTSEIKKIIEKITHKQLIPVSLDTVPIYNSKITINTPIPYNNQFVGRRTELDELSQKVEVYDVVAIYGMGGMGKTSLAAKYCQEKKSLYEKIVWIPYHNTLEESIMSIDAEHSYRDDGQPLGYGEIINYLNSIEGNKLIVIDNFDIKKEDINTKFDEIQRSFSSYKILITTRTKLSSREEDIYIYDLEEMKKDEAVLLFKKYFGRELDEDQVSSEQLSLFLDTVYCHTLIIELVAKHLRKHFTIKLSEIIGYVKKEGDLDISDPVDVKWHKMHMAITDISTELYNKDLLSDDERELLEVLAILCEESIDVRFVMNVIAPDNRTKFEELIDNLSTNGWINNSELMISCHRILADIILKDVKFKPALINSILNNIAVKTEYNALDDITAKRPYYQMQRFILTYVCSDRHIIDGISHEAIAHNSINFYYNGTAAQTGGTFKVNVLGLPEVLNGAAAQTGNKLKLILGNNVIEYKLAFIFLQYAKTHGAPPLLKCHINECLSKMYQDSYKYNVALDLLLEADRIEKEIQVGDTLDKARTSYSLAALYDYLDKKADAIVLLNQSYKIYTNLLGQYCVENLENCLLFMSIFGYLENQEKANYWMEEAKCILENADIAELNPLRINYYLKLSERLNNEEKLSYIKEAQTLAIKIYGEDHPVLCDIYSSMMWCYLFELNDYKKALECITKWRDLDIINFGDSVEGAFVFDACKNLLLFCELSRNNDEQIWRKFLEAHKESPFDSMSIHLSIPIVKIYLNLVGDAYFNLKCFDIALEYYQKVLSIIINESYNSNISQKHETINEIYSIIGKSEKISSKILGYDDFISILNSMVDCLIELSDCNEAEKEINKIVDTYKLDNQGLSSRILLQFKGKITLYSADFKKAEKWFNMALEGMSGEQLEFISNLIADTYFNYGIKTMDEWMDKEKDDKNNFDKDLREFAVIFKKSIEHTIHVDDEILLARYRAIEIICSKLNDYAEEEFYLKKGIEIMRKKRGEESSLADKYNGLGKCLLNQGKRDEARDCFKKALELVIKYDDEKQLCASIYSNIADLQMSDEDFAEAEKNLSNSISLLNNVDSDETTKNQISNYSNLGICLHKLSRDKEAFATIKRALELAVSLNNRSIIFQVNKLLADMYNENEDYPNAEKYFGECLQYIDSVQDENRTLQFLMVYGVVLARQKKTNEAIDVMLQALDIATKGGSDLLQPIYGNLANLYKEECQYIEAEKYFHKRIELFERTNDANTIGDILDDYVNLGICLYKLKKNDEAKKTLNHAFSIAGELYNDIKDLLSFCAYIANIHSEEGEYEETERYYRIMLETLTEQQGEEFSQALCNTYIELCTTLCKQDKRDEAKRLLEGAAKKFQHEKEDIYCVVIRSFLAELLMNENNHELAEKQYRICISQLENKVSIENDNNVTDLLGLVLMRLGKNLFSQGMNDECLEVLLNALSLTSDENVEQLQSIHSNLAGLYKEKGELDKAEGHYREQIAIIEKQGEEVSPHNLADAYDDLGVLLFQIDRNSEAIVVLEHALQIIRYKEDEIYLIAAIHNHLAQIYQNSGDSGNAELHKKEFNRLKEEMDKMHDTGQGEGSIAQGETTNDES